MNRFAVFPDASRDGASIDVLLRDTNDRQWPGWTSTIASLHRGHNHRNNSHSRRQSGESADANARGRRAGAQGEGLEQEVYSRCPGCAGRRSRL